jgi:hypothetical protein
MDEIAKQSGSSAVREQSAIEEKFPRIAKALCELWGQEGYTPYLRSLVFDERGGRQGFPPDVSSELFSLYGLLDYQVGGDVWTQSDQRI